MTKFFFFISQPDLGLICELIPMGSTHDMYILNFDFLAFFPKIKETERQNEMIQLNIIFVVFLHHTP